MAEVPDSTLSYERRFVPALAWSVRGAMLQWGGRMAVVEDDGQVVFDARASSGLVFAAVVLGVVTVVVLVGPMIFMIFKPLALPKMAQLASSLVGACTLLAAVGCYLLAMSSMEIWLSANGSGVGKILRRRTSGRSHIWSVQSDTGEALGAVRTGGNTELYIFSPAGKPLLTVAMSALPGLSQAAWRALAGQDAKAKGRLRIGMGAGARLEIDDVGFAIDQRLLAALLLAVAVQGK